MNPSEIHQIGPYRVVRLLGEGGFAWVFEVVDPSVDAHRALKMLKPGSTNQDDIDRFRREGHLQARINHPNLMPIFGFGRDEATGCFYYTMPLLRRALGDLEQLTPEQAVPIFLRLLAALAALHANGVIHRDIKPSNIRLFPDGSPVLCDLGIARVTPDPAEADRTTTRRPGEPQTTVGAVMGTRAFMPPEQGLDATRVDARSDLFSLGLCLYRMLVGPAVWEEVSDTTSHRLLKGKEIDFDFERVPRRLRGVVSKACRIDPDQRYQSAAAMAAALDASLGREPGVGRLLPAAAAILVVLAGYGWYVWYTTTRAFEAASQLALAAQEVLTTATTLEPPSDAAVLSEAQEDLENAGQLLERARIDLEKLRYSRAEFSIDMAGASYEAACGRLLEHLEPRYQKGLEQPRNRIRMLEEVGAPGLAAGSWPELATLWGEINTDLEEEKCGRASSVSRRLSLLPDLQERIVEVAGQLSSHHEALAREKHEEANAWKERATARAVDAKAYKSAVGSGSSALRRSEKALGSGDFPESFRQSEQAIESFKTATDVAVATQTRQRTHDLVRQLPTPPGIVSRSLSDADIAYEDGRWSEAADLYQGTIRMLEEKLPDPVVLTAMDEVEAARERALGSGAERSAPTELAAADAALTKARSELEAGSQEGVVEAAREAQRLYADAGGKAEERLRQARGAVQAARKDRGALGVVDSCQVLAPGAREDCRAGVDALAEAERALSARDAPAAIAQADLAASALRRARERDPAGAQRPPKIVKRFPKGQSVQVTSGASLSFSVEASDPNSDPLRYAWRVDGETRPETGPKLDLVVDRAARVVVKVQDGRGGSADAAWDLTLENRNPILTLAPEASPVCLNARETQVFTASATDPEGGQVTTEILIDGEVVATGSQKASFTYRPYRAGRALLEARARDAQGGLSSTSRELVIGAARSDWGGRGGPRRSDCSPPGAALMCGVPETALEALSEYRAAIEQRDIHCLRLLVADAYMLKVLIHLIESNDRIEVETSLRNEKRHSDGRISLRFDQALSLPNSRARSTCEAEAVDRQRDGWQFKSLKCQGSG